MKNLIKKIVSVVIAITMLMFTNTTSFAFENNENNLQMDGLFIATKSVPEEVVDYTQSTIGGIVQDIYDLSTITVGKPFTVEGHSCDLYYFLVYSNRKLVGNYRVFNTGDGYTGIFSENDELLAGFNEVKSLISIDNPARIVVGEYEDIYAVTSNEIIGILDDPEGRISKLEDAVSYFEGEILNTVNVNENINIIAPMAADTGASKYLAMGYAETQGNLPWCAAYATASICRYVTGNSGIMASNVMRYAYPSGSISELNKKSLSHSQVISYGQYLGLSPQKSSSRLSWNNIKMEIDGNRPVYFSCNNISTGDSSHALVCRGYSENSGNSFYSVWNPWYENLRDYIPVVISM